LIILALVYLALLLMLAVKILEGLIRLFGGVGFDRSKRTMDSGLVGALGLLGCCGGNRKRSNRHRSRRHRTPANLPTRTRTRDSDLSSYTPPPGGIVADGTATPPHFLHAGSRQGSTHSQPPSVLKPEHANRPYKEELLDTEDEGYIMGAWQPFPPRNPTGYAAVSDSPQATNPIVHPPKSGAPAASSGFSRVGGGRAHIDTPYAIQSGSTQAFPSLGQQSQQSQIMPHGGNHSHSALSGQPLVYHHPVESTDEVPISLSNVEMGTTIGMNGLPPGAMQPAHIRTKSQTAIVEDYTPAAAPSASSLAAFAQGQIAQPGQPGFRQKHLSQDTFLRPPGTAPSTQSKFMLGDEKDDEDSETETDHQKKKKPWYHLRRNRPHSSEGRTSTANSTSDLTPRRPADEEMGALGSASAAGGSGEPTTPQRSFVVIRKPPGSMGRIGQPGAAGGGATAGPSSYPKASSRPPTR